MYQEKIDWWVALQQDTLGDDETTAHITSSTNTPVEITRHEKKMHRDQEYRLRAIEEAKKWQQTRDGYLATRHLQWYIPTYTVMRDRFIRQAQIPGIDKGTSKDLIMKMASELWIPINTEEGPTWGTDKRTWDELDDSWCKQCECSQHNGDATQWPETQDGVAPDDQLVQRRLVCRTCGGRRRRNRRHTALDGVRCEWCGKDAPGRCVGCGTGVHIIGECLYTRPWGHHPVVGAHPACTGEDPDQRRCPDCMVQWAREWHEYTEDNDRTLYWDDEYQKRIMKPADKCKSGAGHARAKPTDKGREDEKRQDIEEICQILSNGEWTTMKALKETFRVSKTQHTTITVTQADKHLGESLNVLTKPRSGKPQVQIEVHQGTKRVRMLQPDPNSPKKYKRIKTNKPGEEDIPTWVDKVAKEAIQTTGTRTEVDTQINTDITIEEELIEEVDADIPAWDDWQLEQDI